MSISGSILMSVEAKKKKILKQVQDDPVLSVSNVRNVTI
jgi:hypothetical protein